MEAGVSRTQIWSSGGGVQSSAIAALICMGELEKPDLAVIVDTERELSTTWAYLESYVMPALCNAGVKLNVVKKSEYATVDLMGGKDGDDLLIPCFTTQGGELGKLPTFCSNEWKARVMRRWAADQGVTQADIWMGFSIDEMKRVKVKLGKWQNRFPLIEKRMTRGDCMAAVKRMGWPDPPRSSCWMCPNHSHHEWQWIKDNAPADFIKAVNFENQIRLVDADMWLSDTAASLADGDFTKPDDLFSPCKSGECFV